MKPNKGLRKDHKRGSSGSNNRYAFIRSQLKENRLEGHLPGIRAFSERYVFLASEGRRRSAKMPAEQQITLTRKC